MLCLLCPTPDDQRPRGSGSNFEALFGDFVRGREALWWAIDGGGYGPWELPSAWYGDDEVQTAFYERFVSSVDGQYAVATGAVFRDAMKYLSDIWIEIHAFRERPEGIDGGSWWHGPGLAVPAHVARGAEHSFVNVDGAYWVVLSLDETLLRGFAERWTLARFVPIEPVKAI